MNKDNLKRPDNQDLPDRKKARFIEDTDIPKRFRGLLDDYLKSGFDRGHLVPAADIRISQEALNETFLCTLFYNVTYL